MGFDWNGRINSYLQRTGTVPPGASDILGTLGSACQGAVERSIGRTLDAVDYVEAYTGTGKNVLFLRHDPIVTVTSVYQNGNLVTVADPNGIPSYPSGAGCAVNSTADGLILTNGDAWDDSQMLNVLVSYSAGLIDYATKQPPEDLAFAVVYWASLFFRRRDRIGEASSSIGGQITTFSQDIPADVKRMIDAHRRPFIPC
jgi:hypothetical protein